MHGFRSDVSDQQQREFSASQIQRIARGTSVRRRQANGEDITQLGNGSDLSLSARVKGGGGERH